MHHLYNPVGGSSVDVKILGYSNDILEKLTFQQSTERHRDVLACLLSRFEITSLSSCSGISLSRILWRDWIEPIFFGEMSMLWQQAAKLIFDQVKLMDDNLIKKEHKNCFMAEVAIV
jgi:hypothetical protein